MSYLNKMLENGVFVPPGFYDSDVNYSTEIARRQMNSSIVFRIENCEEIHELKRTKELSMLPYNDCVFEYKQKDTSGKERTLIAHYCKTEGENGETMVFGFMSSENTNKFGLIGLATIYDNNDNVSFCQYSNNDGKDELKYDFFESNIIGLIDKFLSALNCVNVNKIEHKPPEKLQKARAKRGKKPLFSFWTLELDLHKSLHVGADIGGTHASPRLHLRRGHPRQYAPGKYCWVQPHVVGNKKLGMIHKDYSAKYHHAAVA